MAMSTCTKCGNTQFEVKEVTPKESNFILNFVQCTSCGGVIGVIDFHNIGELIHQLADKLNVPFLSIIHHVSLINCACPTFQHNQKVY